MVLFCRFRLMLLSQITNVTRSSTCNLMTSFHKNYLAKFKNVVEFSGSFSNLSFSKLKNGWVLPKCYLNASFEAHSVGSLILTNPHKMDSLLQSSKCYQQKTTYHLPCFRVQPHCFEEPNFVYCVIRFIKHKFGIGGNMRKINKDLKTINSFLLQKSKLFLSNQGKIFRIL